MKQDIEKINKTISNIHKAIIIILSLFIITLTSGLFMQESYHYYIAWINIVQIFLGLFCVVLIWWNNYKKLKLGCQDLVSQGFDHIVGSRYYSLKSETEEDKIDIMYVVDLTIKDNELFYVLEKHSLEISEERLSRINWIPY